jgi:transposase
MTDSHTTPEAAILVAVDIAKDHNEVLIELRERRDRHHRFRVANTLEEYKRLVAYLRQLDAPALIGFEATGNYHRPLAYFPRSGFRAAVDSHYSARLARPAWSSDANPKRAAWRPQICSSACDHQ